MKKTLIATLALTVSASAFAWGDREQAALVGMIAGMVLQQQRQVQVAPPVYYPQQQPVIIHPPVSQPPVVIMPYNGGRTCLQHPYHDQYGRLLGYQLSCH